MHCTLSLGARTWRRVISCVARSLGVLLAEIITGEAPSKRYGLRPPRCTPRPSSSPTHQTPYRVGRHA